MGLSVGIRNGDVPCKRFAACPRDERRAVRPLPVSSRLLLLLLILLLLLLLLLLLYPILFRRAYSLNEEMYF